MTPTLLAIACLLTVTLGYLGVCAASPFGACRKCRGFGYALTTDRRGRPKRGRHCRRCRATGRRIRTGRWLYNRAARIHRAGTDRPRSGVGR
ncbi:hypothetical protein O7599_22910 [Streptomyces sp. WMMC500]|uniref:hypothetical protein n=1 Tax=Streptomyces sp. WMMC500 TaxID=3015154 RepID=UPI00248D2C91|nr:hypothetical protein [Streptomyces sp. WMMC500]WBB58476.1 hypothetical protein O7599_22910 [Streptomyces sp. WMMC500]